MSIANGIVELLSTWNKDRPYTGPFYDQAFVSILLKHLFGKELINENLDPKVLDFIREIFICRTKNDEKRAGAFDRFVSKKQQKQKEKLGIMN